MAEYQKVPLTSIWLKFYQDDICMYCLGLSVTFILGSSHSRKELALLTMCKLQPFPSNQYQFICGVYCIVRKGNQAEKAYAQRVSAQPVHECRHVKL